MADLTADFAQQENRDRGDLNSYIIADGVTIFTGGLYGLEAGFLNHWANGEDDLFQGVLISGDHRVFGSGIIIGETSDAKEPRGWVDTKGLRLDGLTSVAGSPTQANVGDKIYCATSNPDDMTLVAGGGPAIGWLSDFIVAANVSVTLFTPAEFAAQRGGIYNLTFQFDLADIADGDLVTDLILGHKFEILENFAIVNEAVTTASDLSTIGLEIGSTAVTNSAVALTSANATPAGVIIDNAGALALNVGSETDTLTVIASATTAFAEGKINYIIRIRTL